LDENRPQFHNVLQHADRLILDASAEVLPTLKSIRTGADTIPVVVKNVDENVESILEDASGLVRAVSPELVSSLRSFRGTVESLQTRIETIQGHLVQLLGSADSLIQENQPEVERILLYLERTSMNLDDITNQLAKNPWRILWKTEERKTPDRVSPDWDPLKEQ
jgi:ABC-type transporter Mla subunit MlaD